MQVSSLVVKHIQYLKYPNYYHMKQHSMAFLICWQGPYPWYLPYFLHSCRYNPNIDFLIFTDNGSESLDIPENVRFIPYSIEQFKTDAAKKLGFKVAI